MNKTPFTVVVEDDTADAVKNAVITASLAFKGDVFWAWGLRDLDSIIANNGVPNRIILDNNLEDGRGYDWLNAPANSDIIRGDTVIAALSSTNMSLIIREYKQLNLKGLGAFPKAHIAELCLWMALQEKYKGTEIEEYWRDQRNLYDVINSDDTFMTGFGRRVDKSISINTLPRLAVIHPSRMSMDTWPFQNRSIIIPANDSVGLFQRMLRDGMKPEDIHNGDAELFRQYVEKIKTDDLPQISRV